MRRFTECSNGNFRSNLLISLPSEHKLCTYPRARAASEGRAQERSGSERGENHTLGKRWAEVGSFVGSRVPRHLSKWMARCWSSQESCERVHEYYTDLCINDARAGLRGSCGSRRGRADGTHGTMAQWRCRLCGGRRRVGERQKVLQGGGLRGKGRMGGVSCGSRTISSKPTERERAKSTGDFISHAIAPAAQVGNGLQRWY